MKSKLYQRIMLAVLFISVTEMADAQTPDWLWANSIGGNIISGLWSTISVDPTNGDVFSIGRFWGTADFDPGEGTYYLTVPESAPTLDLFISKLDSAGHFLWVRSISGILPVCFSNYCVVNDMMAIDHRGSGDIYITGGFANGTVDFDPGSDTFKLTANENRQGYILKLDRSGNFIWAKSIGGNDSVVNISSIAIDPARSGDVYLSGSFSGTVDFDPGPETYYIAEDGDFISKFDSFGHFEWANSITHPNNVGGNVSINSVVVGPENGDVYITGDFGGMIDFNPGPDIFNLTSTGDLNLFVSKLDSAGNFQWVKAMGGWGIGRSITVSPGSEDINIMGEFSGTVDFDPGSGIYNLSTNGARKLFVTQLDSSGNFHWAKPIGAYYSGQRNKSFTIDQDNGDTYTTGSFYGTTDFDPGPDSFKITSAGESDVFISKLDSSGNFEWAMAINGSGYEENSSIDIDALGHIYIGGTSYSSYLTFGSTNLMLPDTNYSNLFIAKLGTSIKTSVTEIIRHPINIYPNPTTNELTIEFEENRAFNLEITIFNILGEVVLSSAEQYIFHKKTIDVSTLSAGIYFVEVNLEEERVIRKIVKN